MSDGIPNGTLLDIRDLIDQAADLLTHYRVYHPGDVDARLVSLREGMDRSQRAVMSLLRGEGAEEATHVRAALQRRFSDAR